jgi:hypothetical protein
LETTLPLVLTSNSMRPRWTGAVVVWAAAGAALDWLLFHQ